MVFISSITKSMGAYSTHMPMPSICVCACVCVCVCVREREREREREKRVCVYDVLVSVYRCANITYVN
uniref:Uncharacterized protein n=1 Tax=Populus trichocarpa TaxID=3694 RepID=A0A2K1YAE2_POPTR